MPLEIRDLRLDDRQDVAHPSLDTGNDDENVWMVRVNELLGFIPSLHSVVLVKRR